MVRIFIFTSITNIITLQNACSHSELKN